MKETTILYEPTATLFKVNLPTPSATVPSTGLFVLVLMRAKVANSTGFESVESNKNPMIFALPLGVACAVPGITVSFLGAAPKPPIPPGIWEIAVNDKLISANSVIICFIVCYLKSYLTNAKFVHSS